LSDSDYFQRAGTGSVFGSTPGDGLRPVTKGNSGWLNPPPSGYDIPFAAKIGTVPTSRRVLADVCTHAGCGACGGRPDTDLLPKET